MRNVIALAVGLALAWGTWSLGAAPGDTSGGTPVGAALPGRGPVGAHPPQHRPNPVGTPVHDAPDIPVPEHSAADLDRALLRGVWRLPPCTRSLATFCTGTDDKGLWWRDRDGHVVHYVERFEGEPEEDQPGWNCAVHGNRDCG